jgi:hypothetical protein
VHPVGIWIRDQHDRIDVLEFVFADLKGMAPPFLTSQSFRVDVGVFLKHVPHAMGARFVGFGGFPVDGTASCQFRLRLQPPRLLSGVRSQEFWFVDSAMILANAAVRSAIARIKSDALPWFDTFRDLSHVLDRALAGSAWSTMAKRSAQDIRSPDLVLGLLAVDLGRWHDAVPLLTRALGAKNPVRLIDPAQPDLLYQALEPEIRAALTLATDRAKTS